MRNLSNKRKAGCRSIMDKAGCSRIQNKPRAELKRSARMVLLTMTFALLIRVSVVSPRGFSMLLPVEALLIHV